ncbi:cytochrome O ubiquinol oxidase [Sporanaerobium hydrogeniformans]|uniref:Cytochrome O ubiquinol oxidase n=1 Tax=Sporanaerobium hydrogeniformans TaxID=3072179 RepID=A0AC61DFL1_9FIRM|nr:DedA family protein [Sporanaerobium hydrogeniformans]PHV71710.1 cytochrome O ubiquinol oxidase [Sporanaerobium hydrogeniformans]
MSIITSFLNQLMNLVGLLGYPGIFAIIGLEYACFPIPSEVVLPFVGMSITQTHLSFFIVFLVSICAGLIGSLLCYAIGFWGGAPFLAWLSKHSSNAEKATCKFNRWFDCYGRWAVLLARIVPLTRTYISFFAGASRMSLSIFLLYSSVGISAWNLVLISLGYFVGDNWPLIERLLNTYSNVVLILLALTLLLYVINHFFCKVKKAQ